MRILVAEDEEDIRTVYHGTLADRGHEIVLTSNGEECLKVYREKIPEQLSQQQQQVELYQDNGVSSSSSPSSYYFDVVILDYKMPKKDGLQQLKKFLK